MNVPVRVIDREPPEAVEAWRESYAIAVAQEGIVFVEDCPIPNEKMKEALRRIGAKQAESTDLAVTTIERLSEACEAALGWAESPYGVSAEARAKLRDKLREALGKPK